MKIYLISYFEIEMIKLKDRYVIIRNHHIMSFSEITKSNINLNCNKLREGVGTSNFRMSKMKFFHYYKSVFLVFHYYEI
jgi:hypothetical protein